MLSTLATKRVLIRPLRLDDVPSIHQLYADIDWADRRADEPTNLARRRSWVEWSIRNYEQLAQLNQPPYGDRAVVLKDGETFAGLVGLVPLLAPFGQLPSFGGVEGARYSPEVRLFWAISPALQGRGYAVEAARALIDYAFTELQLARILAGTEHANVASIAVMRRLGMQIERNPSSQPEWFQTVGILHAPDRR